MMTLIDKVAIVTGAASGIGRAVAERLAERGATVVVNYGSSAEKARQVVAGIQAKGGTAAAVHADMGRIEEARRLVRETVSRYGRLDILINNAALFFAKPLAQTYEEEFDRICAVNVKGPFFAMQEAASVIEEGGSIVNVSSDGTHMGLGGMTAYLGTKAALEQFTKGLAHELAAKHVRVSTVSPGLTDTAMLAPRFRETGAQLSPLKRLGTPYDIADVVEFLVSDRSQWLTGQNIHAGGGLVM